MPTSLTLESVKVEFDHWRQQKKHSQSRIPALLRKKALALLTHYSSDEIIKTLKIPAHRFASWGDSEPVASDDSSASTIDFVPLAMPAAPPSKRQPAPIITLKGIHPSGMQWSLEGDFSPAQVSAVMTALGSLPGGCS